MAKLGVVVAVYNTEKYIKKCMDSIVNQTYRDLEVVIVDDGSTDESAKICDLYLDYANVTVVHQKNRGKLAARNEGVQLLDCDYVTFVDSDDWLDEDLYEKLAPLFEENIDIIAYGMYTYFNDQSIVKGGIYHDIKYYNEKEIKEEIVPTIIYNEKKNTWGVGPSLCNKIVKRDLVSSALQRASHVLNISYGDDMAVTFPMMYEMMSYRVVEVYGYYYRIIPGRVPEYICDNQFFEKLLNLYNYLLDTIGRTDSYIKQADILFAHAVNYKLKKYYNYNSEDIYIFPFDKVPVNSKILLYGAGNVGTSYYYQVNYLDYCEEVLWVDERASIIGYPVNKLEKMHDWRGDYVVIAIMDQNVSTIIRNKLETEYGIDGKKIIWMCRNMQIK